VEIASRIKRPLNFQKLFESWKQAVLQMGLNKISRQKFPELSEKIFEEKKRRVKDYLFERLYTFAWPKPTPSADVIAAVLNTQPDDLVDAMDRIHNLQQLHLKHKQELLRAAKVVERTHNILKGAPAQPHNGVDPARLQEPLERQLHTLYESKKGAFTQLVEQKSYAEATTLFAETFYEPLHAFFDQVLVNVDDEGLRRNRLALLHAINTLYTGRIADLSKLAILQQQGA
jgi:glycyl-tRNA synthetase beta chain